MKNNNSSFSRINLNMLSMFYAQCDNKGSMYKLAVKVIDDVKYFTEWGSGVGMA
jgi:hypothetical protein